ncbi:hypothetical protein SAMN05444370_1267 [Rubrimonas cliftonensis]|uniref:Uncharacterized protein n=1 Tax=Rubrimonas cliftonensis TaxID=89524 RepID=A0A1H4FNX7_9RHOB|nr:hypothetical protein SAMN05444370_1267 [Rubrimonas cliftonensis]
MREDAAAGRPFTAALVVGRLRGGVPAPGCFELDDDLGRGPADREDQGVFHARIYGDALTLRTDRPRSPLAASRVAQGDR